MSHHTTEIRYTSSDHRYGVLYDPRDPAAYVSFTVSRMNGQVSFKHNGSAARWPHQRFTGAARRLLGSTNGINYAQIHDSIMNPIYYITVTRGAK